MKWIRTAGQIGQAVKNVQRLRQIVGVLSKHGFATVIQRMDLGRFLPARLSITEEAETERSAPERLRLAFEELGPTFVKLGQLLSTRPDLLPESYIEEFTKLQDNVKPLPFELVKLAVERELNRTLDQAFATFKAEPLAAASIAQVHEATLKDGTRVVVKVQRPEIEKMIETDVSLLAFLAGLLEKYIPESRVIGPRTVVDEFFRTLDQETDFAIEANNMARMARNLSVFPEIVIPKVYKNLSSRRVLTLEQLEGIRVNDVAALDAAGIDRKAVVSLGARAFFRSIMVDGLFHGDLHGGNLFILPGNRLGIIDFGIVGRLSERSRDQLATMVVALLNEDFETLCYVYADLSSSTQSIDFEGFQRETRNVLAPYLGLSLGELNAGRILIEATRIATRYNIKVPGDWMIVFKAILTMEGMGRTLDPDFDLLALGQELTGDLLKRQYNLERIGRELLWLAKDTSSLIRILPRQLKAFIRRFSANDFALEVRLPQLDDIRAQMDLNGRRMSLSVLAAGLFVATALALQAPGVSRVGDYPLPAVLFFGAGCFMLVRLFFRSFR